MLLQVEVDGAEIDPESQEWIEGIVDRLREISKTMLLDSYVADWNAVQKATEEQAWKDLGLLVIGFLLVTCYTNVVLYKNSSLACKMHLSFASLTAIGFSLWSAYGIAQIFGVKVIDNASMLSANTDTAVQYGDGGAAFFDPRFGAR